MPMDSAREQSHHQEVGGAQTLESMVANSKAAPEKKPRPAENSLKCPRCESTNTKFCYYNNYSLSQPRYFCKSCRRYWTKGGTLRNVPVGGGCRKNKRSSSSSSGSARRHNHDNPKITPPSYAATPPPYETDLPFHKPPSGLVGILDEPGMSGGDYGLVEALRGGGFLEIQRGFHNFYGGNGNGIGNGDGVSFGMECGPGFGMGMGTGIEIGVLNREMGLMGFEDFGNGGAVASVKQEARNGEQWGLSPWPNVGGEDLDPARIGSWNGIGSSSWHGLLNSPLV